MARCALWRPAGFGRSWEDGGWSERWNRRHHAGYRGRRPSAGGHASPDPVAPGESPRGNPSAAKNTCPVNSGRSSDSWRWGKYFLLGIPEDSLIVGTGGDTNDPCFFAFSTIF